MDSELVQRLQAQLLDLRTENCDFSERNKFLEAKFKTVQDEKEEMEKELRSLVRKNKAFSFMPGQSLRDEIVKLEAQIEHKDKALEKQEIDFQRHDQALRDEIAALNRKVQESGRKIKKTNSKSSVNSMTHPLDKSDDSAVDVDELEKSLATQVEESQKIAQDRDEKAKAIRELEKIIKVLRKENDDLKSNTQLLNATQIELKDTQEKAEKRKQLSDNLAKEVAQLKQVMKESEDRMKMTMSKHEQTMKNEKDVKVKAAKDEIIQLQEQCKNSEIKLVDCNRRIDKLLDENNEIQKNNRALRQTKEYIERSLDEFKDDKQKVENDFENLKSQVELTAVKYESEKAELEDLLRTEKEGRINDKKIHLEDKEKEKKLQLSIQAEYEAKIEEEIEKQRIVERKAAVTVRELKKQLSIEKKRAEKLQEKIKTVDSTQLVEPERLMIPHIAAHRDETSSIGSWSLPTEFDGVTILTGNEAEAILLKNKQVSEINIQLEEQLRALEKNQIQMSEELANKEEILKMRVWNTRPDAQRTQRTSNPISDLIINKITELATDQTSTHEQNPAQLKQLNKKLLRMLEEEMTKNVALRKNIEDLARLQR